MREAHKTHQSRDCTSLSTLSIRRRSATQLRVVSLNLAPIVSEDVLEWRRKKSFSCFLLFLIQQHEDQRMRNENRENGKREKWTGNLTETDTAAAGIVLKSPETPPLIETSLGNLSKFPLVLKQQQQQLNNACMNNRALVLTVQIKRSSLRR